MAYTLEQIAQHIGAELRGDPNVSVETVATLESAGDRQVAFLSNTKYRKQLNDCAAAAVIVSPDDAEHCPNAALVMKNPYLGFVKVAQLLDTTPQSAEKGIHASAVIDPSAEIGKDVSIGANTVIEAGASIGDGTVIGAQCYVGHNTSIGKHCFLWASVRIYHAVTVGDNCRFQSGAVIGSEGFGYANHGGKWVRIPQLGSVRIEDNVEIGANSCVDRGALDDTVIETGVIIDNLCQIAHNVQIGAHTAFAGMASSAGSTKIGKHCIVGGATALNGHIEIGDQVHFTGRTMVVKGFKEPGVYSSGVPAMNNRDWRKNAARFGKLDEMYRKLRQLEKQISTIQAGQDTND